MKVNKKRLFGISILTALAVSAAGCSSSDGEQTADETGAASAGTLTVWVDSNRAEAMEQVAADFEAAKGIAVEIVVRDLSKIQEDFTAQVPTGEGPDITIGSHDWIGALVRDGVIAPVELGDKTADFNPVAIEAVSYDGQVYGVPYSVENVAILRNTALADSTPATFDEMIAAGEASGAEYPFLIGLDENTGDSYHLYPFQTSFGSSVFAQNADGTFDPTQLTIGDDAGVEFAEWLGEQGEAGILKPGLTSDLAKAAFNEGKSPYYISGAWNLPDAEAAGIDVAVDPIPSAGGEAASPFVGVQAFFISAKSTNALAANEFLVNYIATLDVQTALFEVGARLPALTEAAEAAIASDPLQAGFAAAAENGVPMPSVPEMGSVWEDWGKASVAIMKGADPESTWEEMAASIQEKIG
ncbi:MAG: extracellular solute-binding protein [Microbacterium sp.]